MAWAVDIDPRAIKELAGLSKTMQSQIVDYLYGVASSGDPTSREKRLTGPLSMYWRYRFRDSLIPVDQSRSGVVRTQTLLPLEVDVPPDQRLEHPPLGFDGGFLRDEKEWRLDP